MELLDARQRLMQVACKCYSLDTQRQEMGFVDARCHYEYNRTLQKFSMNANNYTSQDPRRKTYSPNPYRQESILCFYVKSYKFRSF